MMPQFAQPENYRFKAENLSVGMLFVIGLAESAAGRRHRALCRAGFAAPGELMFWGSWGASLCYALQLYFDFSGYSDMALGLAKMFGIRFPLNLHSPYKAGSIIEFWARWHMTLTRYLTAYLYYPVAMAVSKWRTERNLPVGTQGVATPGGFAGSIMPTVYTMGLTGIWHGAGFQFLVFGLLHAMYLSVNHAWRIFVRPQAGRRAPDGPDQARRLRAADLRRRAGGAGLFRANGVGDAMLLVQGMIGMRGIEALDLAARVDGLAWGDAWRMLLGHHMQLIYAVVLQGIAWFTPNAHQILGRYSPALFTQEAATPWMRWRPTLGWLAVMLAPLFFCLINLHKETRFLYFHPDATRSRSIAWISRLSKPVATLIENVILTQVDPDTLLIESGLVDSLAAVDVALAVEREFGCKIPPTEIDVHLESVHTLAAFIAGCKRRLNAVVAKEPRMHFDFKAYDFADTGSARDASPWWMPVASCAGMRCRRRSRPGNRPR